MTRYEIIEAPSVLGLFPKGVEGLSQVLLDGGLAERLAAVRGPLVTPPAYAGGIDPESGVRNATALADYARALADEVGPVLATGAFPIVLGGDCSILLGSLLALRRRGRYGLLFLDGHADFAHPSEDPTGEAASMDLALATGRGPKVVANIEDRGPLVRDDDVALLGYRVFTDGTDRHSARMCATRRSSSTTSMTSVVMAWRRPSRRLWRGWLGTSSQGSSCTSTQTSSTMPSCLPSTIAHPADCNSARSRGSWARRLRPARPWGWSSPSSIQLSIRMDPSLESSSTCLSPG